MPYQLLMSISVIFCGLQFIFTKLYQKRVLKNNFIASIIMSFIFSIAGALYFFILGKGQLHFSWFSFLMGIGCITCIVIYNIFGLKCLEYTTVAVYTLFMMLGGASIPFIYGVIFLKEPITFKAIIGIIALIIALIFPILSKDKKQKTDKRFLKFAFIIFFANGFLAVLNKSHQISPDAVDIYSLGVFENIFQFVVMSIIISIFFIKNKNNEDTKDEMKSAFKNAWVVVLYTIAAITGAVFQLIAAKTAPATILYPFLSGGTIVLTSLAGVVFFKEKLNTYIILSIVFALVSIVFFAI